MTREERHIAVLSRLLESMNVYDSVQPTEERKKAIKAAIQALSQEPTVDVLDKIRAEIDSHCSENRDRNDGLYIAMKIIDKHIK